MAGPVVVVAGALANKPDNGGEAWVRFSWIRGLERLGCRVFFVEEMDEAVCTDAERRPAPFATSVNRAWFRNVTGQFGLAGRAGLVRRTGPGGGEGEGEGLSRAALAEIAAGADLLVNISGNLADPVLRGAFRRAAYVDIDPGFTQFWHAAGNDGPRLAGHHRHFTIGEGIGRPGCSIPSAGFEWIPVRPPVVLDDWPVTDLAPDLDGPWRFTTVATWRGPYGPVETDRRRFGLKVHEFRKFVAIPAHVPATFEAALAIHPAEVADLDLLRGHGWSLTDPARVAGTPSAFGAYVRSSGAEFSAAQGIYVETNSGWFSDRTTRYLASGRPVLVQDTGFSAHLPTGKGLVAFSTFDEAVDGARSILADYDLHAGAARAVAESCFDSDTVLARFLEQCGLWIILAGVLAGVPDQGGASWAVLQYRHGLVALGHDVLLVEPAAPDPAVLAYFDAVVAAEGLAGRAALIHPGRSATGLAYGDVARFAASADVLVNLAGTLADPELTGPVARRIYVDLDPAFSQLWQAQGTDMGFAGHDAHLTVGPGVGTAGCPVPDCGIEWRPTVPPVVLDRWRPSAEPARHGWTTVGHWRSYGSIVHDGTLYGQKAHSVRQLLDLPGLLAPLGAAWEPALAVHPDEYGDVAALAAHGWTRLDPAVVAGDPGRYHRFVTGSTGEIGIAKAGYVIARCGWFSDRSAAYLAAGRPVVAQDTGWTAFLPHGEGLLPFGDAGGAADAVAEVAGNYGRHRKAARVLAEDVFDARRVLPRVLDGTGVRP